MRGQDKKSKPYPLFRTLNSAIGIGVLISIAGLIYLLYSHSTPENRAGDILPVALPFSIIGVLIGATMILSLNNIEKKEWRIASIANGFFSFSYQAIMGSLMIAFFQDFSIGISMICIGLCFLALTILCITGFNKID